MTLPDLAERTVTATLARALDRHPDKLAVRDETAVRTYAELQTNALQLGGGLARLGLSRQQPVLLMLDNHLDFVTTWLATSLTAAIEVPVNTAYKGGLLAYVVNNSGAEVMVVDDRYCERLAAVAGELQQLKTVVVHGGDGGALVGTGLSVVPFDELRQGPPAAPERVHPWDLVGIMYTSGTTGPSKGVLVSHAHAYGYCSAEVWGMARPDDVSLVTLPLFHIGGQWAGVYNALIGGASAVVLPGFSATRFWDDVTRFGCTYTLLLGAMANFLYRQPPTPGDADSPLSRVMMVPVIAELDDFRRRFGVEVSTGYGLTEGSGPIMSPFGEEVVPKGCGRLRDDFEARIVDEHDVEVPTGQVGELVLRPRDPWSVMLGYHGMPEETNRVWRNLWLHTGDAMVRDEAGQYYFVDRKKDAIRRRGENVSSFEVETEVNDHPDVVESAVVAVPSEHTEDEIKAVVVRRAGSQLTEEGLLRRLIDRLPYFMVPRYIEFVDELPKTPTEKVRKQVLRDAGVTEGTWDREAAGIRVGRDS